jgi:glycosyltransferase involved in cell wall biosynthesis
MELFEVGGRSYAGNLREPGIENPRVSVVFTTLNEAENVGPVFARLPHDIYEVILVDGNSKDGTIEAAKAARPDVRTYTQFGRGKGDALRAGFAAATGDIIVALDADGSTLPEEIPLFVSALTAGADFVKASRTLAGGGSEDLTTVRRLGNRGLTTTFNLLYGTHYTDLCYGFNAFWRSTLADLSLSVPGFEIEAAMHARAALSGLRVSEIPSFEHPRLSGAGALVPTRDGIRILRTILGFRGMSVHDPFTIPFDRIGAARWFDQAAGVAAAPLEVP